MKKLQKLAISKIGIGIKGQKKLCKHVNDQSTIETRWNSIVVIEQKVNCKAFAIHILTTR